MHVKHEMATGEAADIRQEFAEPCKPHWFVFCKTAIPSFLQWTSNSEHTMNNENENKAQLIALEHSDLNKFCLISKSESFL